MSRFFFMTKEQLDTGEHRTQIMDPARRARGAPRSSMPSPALAANLIAMRRSAAARRSQLGVSRAAEGTTAAAVQSQPTIVDTCSALRVRPNTAHQYSSLNAQYGRGARTMTRDANFGKVLEFTKANGLESGRPWRMRPELGSLGMNHNVLRSRAMAVQDRTQTSSSHYWGHANT